MRINSRHVVLIEPVGSDSRVAQLTKEAKRPRSLTHWRREDSRPISRSAISLVAALVIVLTRDYGNEG